VPGSSKPTDHCPLAPLDAADSITSTGVLGRICALFIYVACSATTSDLRRQLYELFHCLVTGSRAEFMNSASVRPCSVVELLLVIADVFPTNVANSLTDTA